MFIVRVIPPISSVLDFVAVQFGGLGANTTLLLELPTLSGLVMSYVSAGGKRLVSGASVCVYKSVYNIDIRTMMDTH